MPYHLTPEDCLTLAVEAIGTNKDVGEKVRPDLDPQTAGKWLAHCLDAKHKQRLNYTQERLIYRLACERGQHDGFRAYAESIGYRIEPIDQQAEIAALALRAQQYAEKSTALSGEVMARMAAANLNTDAITDGQGGR